MAVAPFQSRLRKSSSQWKRYPGLTASSEFLRLRILSVPRKPLFPYLSSSECSQHCFQKASKAERSLQACASVLPRKEAQFTKSRPLGVSLMLSAPALSNGGIRNANSASTKNQRIKFKRKRCT